jgi:hypothetical protein
MGEPAPDRKPSDFSNSSSTCAGFVKEPVQKGKLFFLSGFLVQTPRPERFVIHKLIVADQGK